MPKSSFNGIWNKFDAFSPPIVRLMAVNRREGYSEAKTDEEIAEKSGLPIKDIQRIYWSKTWDGITMGDTKAFFHGCGYDLNSSPDIRFLTTRLKKNNQYKWKHIQRSKNHEFFRQLLIFASK